MIEHLKKSPNAVRARDESLQLGVVLTHMLNGCLYRNTTKTPYPQLEADVAMHQAEDLMSEHDVDVYDDERYDWSPVGDKQGLFLLGTIVSDHGSYLTDRRRVLDGDMLALAYKAEDMPTLRGLFGQTGIRVVPSKRNPYRVPNRQTQTSSTINHRTEPVPERNLGLADRGIRIDIASREGRPSIARMNEDERLQGPISEGKTASIVPDGHSNREGERTRQAVQVAGFAVHAVPRQSRGRNILDGHNVRPVFPADTHHHQPSLQNYVQCTYWKQWSALLAKHDEVDIPALRRALLGLFNQMLWLPQPENDRIWNTRQAGASSAKAVPTGSRGPAPILAVNPLVYKGERWVIRSMSSDEEQADREQAARDERIRRREEEEESSE
ncbi:uncharacterized protein B0H18DRAFT_1128571 [Fomitopsis serialis]|uniref:uncharacterized protein n=1 Tax=Fomitopsis serialis TaxID=139415 RepID=UPI002007C4FE|nr:uncharacterized protein B0H18DRAFT_1128571 [Neoantrodia serialis]KAH9911526.1 hypothetical protein B0H18DRAFT_1128571 [Neoantrodia serialis]